MTLKGLSGSLYQTTGSPIGSGGEGDIFRLSGTGESGGKVAKLYKPEAISRELEEKLKLMVKKPPNASVLSQVAWPLDVVYENGSFRGFVMQELSINSELGDVYKYPPVLQLFTRQKITIAQNICAVISEVHKAGYVFGDFNPRNIGLDKNTGLVSFLDTDTYHVVQTGQGQTYRCNVCAPGYAAPELLEKCSGYVAKNPTASKHAYAQTPLPTFTKETDNFALAIHIFKLLMNGYTPFGGIIETASVSQASPGVGDTAVRRDNYCFKPGYKHQSAAIMPLETFPQEIASLFTMAFIAGKHDPRQRPSAIQWHGALTKYLHSLVDCRENYLHQYDGKNAICPLCEADRRYGAALSAAAAPSLRQNTYSPPSSSSRNFSASSSRVPPVPPDYGPANSYTNSRAASPPASNTMKIVLAAIVSIAAIVVIAVGLSSLFAPAGNTAPPPPPPQSGAANRHTQDAGMQYYDYNEPARVSPQAAAEPAPPPAPLPPPPPPQPDPPPPPPPEPPAPLPPFIYDPFSDVKTAMHGWWIGTYLSGAGVRDIYMWVVPVGSRTYVRSFLTNASGQMTGLYASELRYNTTLGRFETVNSRWLDARTGVLAEKYLWLDGNILTGHMNPRADGSSRAEFWYSFSRYNGWIQFPREYLWDPFF